jgi:8-oxo-dGTP diphosphatase
MSIAPGVAVGRTHLVDDPNRWGASTPNLGEVLSLPSLWWPPTEELPRSVTAILLHGAPQEAGAPLGIPILGGVDVDLLREGEIVRVDGDAGSFSIEGVAEAHVVTAFLEREDGRILLLQRSSQVGSFQGRWAGVSGFVEEVPPLAQAIREVREETGIEVDEAQLLAVGPTVAVRDSERVFIVHPFRFRVRAPEVRLDGEHTRSEWIAPEELERRSTVPKLDRVWRSVAPSRGSAR